MCREICRQLGKSTGWNSSQLDVYLFSSYRLIFWDVSFSNKNKNVFIRSVFGRVPKPVPMKPRLTWHVAFTSNAANSNWNDLVLPGNRFSIWILFFSGSPPCCLFSHFFFLLLIHRRGKELTRRWKWSWGNKNQTSTPRSVLSSRILYFFYFSIFILTSLSRASFGVQTFVPFSTRCQSNGGSGRNVTFVPT